MALSGINGELISRSWMMSNKANETSHFHLEEAGDTIFLAFKPGFSVDQWFAPENESSFGQTKVKRDQFPCMRSIGSDVDATVNQAFLNNLNVLIPPAGTVGPLGSTGISFEDSVKKAIKDKKKKIVFTGHSSGGATAILATVWYLETNLRDKQNGRHPEPLCVTFGAPLVGDKIFNHALGREKWSRFFFNFVNRFDIVPRVMLSQKASILSHVLSQLGGKGDPVQENDQGIADFYKTVIKDTATVAYKAGCELDGNGEAFLETFSSFLDPSPYRPAGTFVFSTGTRLVSVNNSDAILQILFYASLSSNQLQSQNQSIKDHHIHSYEEMGDMWSNQLPLDGKNSALDDLGLSTRAKQCVLAAMEAEMKRVNNHKDMGTKWPKIEEKLTWLDKKYKQTRKNGYYDSFKASSEEIDFKANVTRAELAGMFDEVLGLVKKGQLPDEFEGLTEWIDLATRYRRLVEPIDIANYYRHAKNGDTGPYMDKGRPNRYIYAHKGYEHQQFKNNNIMIGEAGFWSKVNALNLGSREEMEKELKKSGSKCGSCFWAEVEELRGKPYENVEVRIKTLDGLLEGWIQEREVEAEQIFLEGSTFRKWWDSLHENHRLHCPVIKLLMDKKNNHLNSEL